MIFRTITDEVTGATKSIGLFGKSLSELKDIFSSINTNGLFKTSVVSKTDLDCITKYNLLIENGIPYLEAMEQATIGASDATKQMIKNANGNTIALDNLTLGAKAASVAMGLLSAAANALVMYGISKLITAWDDYKDKIHEVANENAEQAEKSAEYLDSLLDLQNQLQDGTKSSDELTAAFKEQLKAMGYTEDKIDDLIVKYGGLAGAINEATKEALDNAKTDAYTDLASASKSLEVDSVGGLTKDIQITDFGTGVEELDKQINEILSKAASKTSDNGGSWTAKNNSAEGLYEYYKALQEVSRLIQETASETENKDLLNLGNFFVTTTYGEVTEAIDKLKESAEQYGDAINRLHNADAQLELANYLKTNSIDSKEAFDSYVEGIQKSENYSEEYKQVLLQVANDAFPQFSSAAKDAKNSLDGFSNKTAVQWDASAFNETIQSYEEGYSKLISAQEEWNEAKSISAETFAELQENGLLEYIEITSEGLVINKEKLLENAQAAKDKAVADLHAAMMSDMLKIALGDVDSASDEAKSVIAELGNNIEKVGEDALTSAAGLCTFETALTNTMAAARGEDRGFNGVSSEQKKQMKAVYDYYKNLATNISAIDITTSKRKSSGGSSKSEKDTTKTLDLIEVRVDKLNDALSLLETNLENVQGAFAKNKLIDASIGLNAEKINNYTDALSVYTQKANEALSGIPTDVAEQLKNGAIGIVDYIDDSNGSISEAISNYQKWNDKISECQEELAGLKQALEDLELQKFNNIVEDFTNQFDIHEGGKDIIDAYINYFEASGELIGQSFYETSKLQSEKQLEILNKQKEALVKQINSALNSGRVNLCPAV